MRVNIKKKLVAFFAVSVLATVIMLAVIPAFAASPTYGMSTDYKRGKYYENFKQVELVGDGARDTIAIALSQLGYHEGNDNGGRDGLSSDGDRDFVEYNVLYGKLDNDQGNGLSYGYYWCASFVNWCLRQAEVSKQASAAAEVSCRRWLSACKDAGIYNEKDGYIPKSADLIFFKESGSLVSSTHMGIVLYSDGDRVYTIEGNTSNGSEFSANGNYVALKSYLLSSAYIVGYATPKYEVAENIGDIDYSGESLGVGKYISTDVLKVYSDGSFATETGTIDAFTVFEVHGVGENALLVENGYIKAEKVNQISAENNIRSLSYLDGAGKKIYQNQYAEKGVTVTVTEEIPERSEASFIGWSYGGTILLPGDTIVLDESVELYAVYDDTRPPAQDSTDLTTEARETDVVDTVDVSEPAETENTDDISSEGVTEDVSSTVSDAEGSTEQEQVTTAQISQKVKGCTSAAGAGYGIILLFMLAIWITTHKKRKNNYYKDK